MSKFDFPNMIKKNRTAKGMTVEELAAAVKIPARRLILLEQGNAKPTYEEISAICKEFDIPKMLFLKGTARLPI